MHVLDVFHMSSYASIMRLKPSYTYIEYMKYTCSYVKYLYDHARMFNVSTLVN